MSRATSSDGQRRLAPAEIASGRLEIQVGAGRVELGYAKGDHVRVRWTVPTTRWGRAGAAPRFTAGADGLRIRSRRARLRVDLPTGLRVRVRVRRGQITSWGADAELDLAVKQGNIAGRELLSRLAWAQAPDVNLHFTAEPELVRVTGEQIVVALPGGPYVVTAPEGAEITVPLATPGPPRSEHDEWIAGQVVVIGSDVRVLAAGSPIELTGV